MPVFAEPPAQEGEQIPGHSPSSAPHEENVTVRGVRTPHVSTEPEVASTVVDGERLRQPGKDAAKVLAEVPGVQVNRAGSGAEIATVSLRGASASQVPVYLAGIRLNDDLVGVADLSRIPLWMIHRVEITQGATPYTLSRGGLNGAIEFEPTLPREEKLRVGVLAGSFGTGAVWLGASAAQGSSSGGGPTSSTSVSLRRGGSQNNYTYKSDEGTAFVDEDDSKVRRVNADYDETDLWIISRAQLPTAVGSVRLTLIAGGLFREQGATGLSLFPAEDARERTDQGIVGLRSHIPFLLGSAKGSWESTTSLLASRLRTDDPLDELGLGTSSLDQKNERIAQTMAVRLLPLASIETHLAAAYEVAHLSRGTPDSSWARAREEFFGATASVAYSPDNFLVRGVVRGNCSSTTGQAAFDADAELFRSQCAPAGRLGASTSMSQNVSLRATLVREMRLPTLGELYGASSTTRGNADLQTEQGWSTDVGVRFASDEARWGSLWIDASTYLRYDRSLIAYRRSAFGYVRPYNVGRSRFIGGEVAAQMDLFRHFRARSSLSVLDPRDISEGSDGAPLIPYRSPLTLTQGLEVYAADLLPRLSRASAAAILNYRSTRNADPAGLIQIPGSTTVDLHLGGQLAQRLDLRFRIENLFNTQSFDLLGLPLPGRAAYLSAEAWF